MKKIEYMSIDSVFPYENNPRKNDDAVEIAAESIKQYGFNVPILIDRNHVIIAGHTRYKAAKKLNLEEVPVIVLDFDEDQAKQYRIIDNKTSDLSSWDYEKLEIELDKIPEMDLSFLKFNFENEEDEDEIEGNLNQSVELDIDVYEADRFEFECPYCGFKWNE